MESWWPSTTRSMDCLAFSRSADLVLRLCSRAHPCPQLTPSALPQYPLSYLGIQVLDGNFTVINICQVSSCDQQKRFCWRHTLLRIVRKNCGRRCCVPTGHLLASALHILLLHVQMGKRGPGAYQVDRCFVCTSADAAAGLEGRRAPLLPGVMRRPMEGEELPCDMVGQRSRKQLHLPHVSLPHVSLPHVSLPNLGGTRGSAAS